MSEESDDDGIIIVIFIMLITAGIFIAPRFFRVNNKYLDSTLKYLKYYTTRLIPRIAQLND